MGAYLIPPLPELVVQEKMECLDLCSRGKWQAPYAYPASLYGHYCPLLQISLTLYDNLSYQVCCTFPLQALYPNPDDRWRCSSGKGKQGMKISIQRHDNTVFFPSLLKNDGVLRCGIANLADMDGVYAHLAQQSGCWPWQSLVKQ